MGGEGSGGGKGRKMKEEEEEQEIVTSHGDGGEITELTELPPIEHDKLIKIDFS